MCSFVYLIIFWGLDQLDVFCYPRLSLVQSVCSSQLLAELRGTLEAARELDGGKLKHLGFFSVVSFDRFFFGWEGSQLLK